MTRISEGVRPRFIVENMPGATAQIADVRRPCRADGYTLMISSVRAFGELLSL